MNKYIKKQPAEATQNNPPYTANKEPTTQYDCGLNGRS